MWHTIQQALGLLDSLGDAGSALMLITAGVRLTRALAARFQARQHVPPSDT